ncbi:hypothetical protein [Arthrobacter oryzae]|uniref:Uncharacterized protein n=1 Tax=Arthrobacter oryzae TaxID=409290 RepID=A0A3N0C7Q9_9MICC|nr:hypothetical protein [Arthrobacter oryzae]RNL58972.1 hypothetical protein D7003_03025 [Arthrobacter oryzae]
MAGRPIEIPITVNADGAERGAGQVSDAFEDISDSLRDTGRDGERTAEQLQDDMSDAARQLDRDLTRALDNVADEARTTGRSVSRSMQDGADGSSEGFDQMSEDANSNAREVAASFDGSAESLVDGFQGAAAEMFSGFGPAGAAAGLAIAAGIGLAMAALQGNADLVNENKEKVVELAQTIKDNGGALRQADYIAAMEDYGYAIQDTKEWFEIFQEDALSGFEKMSKLSKEAGIDLKTAFDGSFGSVQDSEKALKLVNEKLEDMKEKKDAVSNTTGSIMDPVDIQTLTSLEELDGMMEENIENQRMAEEMEKARRAAIEGTVEATLEDIAALETKNSLLQDGVTSELDYLDQVAETTKTIEENGKSLDKNTEAGRGNQRALIDQSDAALEMAQSQLTAGTSADVVAESLAAQREALLLQLDAMTGSRAESEKLAASLGLIPTEVITEVKTNGVAESKADIETIPATTDATVNVTDSGTPETQARIQAVQGKEVKIDVDDMSTVAEVQKRIDGIKGRDEIKIDVDDVYTVSEVQKRIDGIKGRDVDVTVRLTNLQSIKDDLALLTVPRTAYVDIVQRRGQEAP